MIRATYGATMITSVIVGSTSATQLFQGREPGGTVLMAGRTWNTVVANRMTSTRATTNSGSAARASSRFELVWSKIFSRFSAAYAPIATDSGIDTTAASATSTAEFTSLGLSNVVTCSWAASDLPRLPCSRPVTQVQYCSITGRSRCSWRRSAARLAGVADRPRMARAGSPGSAWVARNTSTETRTSTRTPSRSRRTMKPPTPPSLSLFMVACPAVLAEVDRAETVPEAVQVEGALAGLEALDPGRVAVDEVAEERDDVAADVVLDLLHLVLDLDALGVVGGGQRLVVQRDEVRAGTGLRRPVALVVRGVRQRALLDLVEVAAGAPEVDREGQLEVLVPVVVRVVDHVDLDPGRLGLVREDGGGVDHAGRAVGGVQVDREVRVPGRLEQRLGLVDVLLPLRQRVIVTGIEGRVQVVPDEPVAGRDLRDHPLPVDQQPHRLADLDVVEGGHVDRHAQRQPAAGLGDQRLRVLGLDDLDLRGGQVGHRVDLAAEQGVHLRGRAGEVGDRDRVEVGLP